MKLILDGVSFSLAINCCGFVEIYEIIIVCLIPVLVKFILAEISIFGKVIVLENLIFFVEL